MLESLREDLPSNGPVDQANLTESTPLVSVVIPCYNQAPYISEAIESVLSQTYKRVEAIVVDDGSTDGSAEIARRFPEIEHVRQKNIGVAEACNTGIRASSGKFVMFLGGDDRLMPEAVAMHLACFAEHEEAGFVAGDLDLINGDGSYRASPRWLMSQGEQYRQILEVNHVANTIAVMFRREVFDRVGYFNTNLRAGEDYEMILRVAWSFPGAQHRDVVTQYRRHSRNMTRDGALMLRCMLDVMRQQRERVAKNAALRRAYKKGVRHWRQRYGAVAARQVLSHLQQAKVLGAIKTGVALVRFVRADLVLLPWKLRRRAFHVLQGKLRALPSIASINLSPTNIRSASEISTSAAQRDNT